MRWVVIKPLGEALGFTGVVLVYIWFLRAWSGGTLAIPIVLVLGSLWWHRETPESLGLNGKASLEAIAAWRWWFAGIIAAVAAIAWLRATPPHLIDRWFVYLAWCVLQQFVYQNMVYRRLREGLGASWGTYAAAGILFAMVHVPNPVLGPATLLWGTVSARLFEARGSVPALALLQALLSTLLYWFTPIELNRQFRVGPGYWTY